MKLDQEKRDQEEVITTFSQYIKTEPLNLEAHLNREILKISL